MTPKEKKLDDALEAAGVRAFPGGKRLKKLTGHAERGELEDGFIVMLTADTCYAIVGVGEAPIKTMSVLVTSPIGSWIAKTKEPEPRPNLRVCAKVSGPHRIGVTVAGRGDYLFGVFGDEPPAVSASAVASAGAPKPSSTASAPAATAPACAAAGQTTAFHRSVAADHRACKSDDDCITIKLDCGALECTGANRAHRAAYSAPLDCRGYDGALASADCDPQLGFFAPRCQQGCCVSARVAP